MTITILAPSKHVRSRPASVVIEIVDPAGGHSHFLDSKIVAPTPHRPYRFPPLEAADSALSFVVRIAVAIWDFLVLVALLSGLAVFASVDNVVRVHVRWVRLTAVVLAVGSFLGSVAFLIARS